MTKTARDLLALATERTETDIPETAAIGSFEPWDSLAHIRLFTALETEIGRELTSEEASGIDSVATLQALLDASTAGS